VDTDPLPSLYYASLDTLTRLLERPGFEHQRPRLYSTLVGLGDNGQRDHAALQAYLQQVLDQARANPLIDVAGQPAAPGFVERFDLDGDGAVDAAEFPALARIAARCDRNGDGRISAKDRP
jgi:hypothetical protein